MLLFDKLQKHNNFIYIISYAPINSRVLVPFLPSLKSYLPVFSVPCQSFDLKYQRQSYS